MFFLLELVESSGILLETYMVEIFYAMFDILLFAGYCYLYTCRHSYEFNN